MRGLFDMDGRFMTVLGKITDCILLSLCWISACLPIVTIGASCGALYRTVYRCIRKDDGGPLKLFWTTWKKNLKNGILVWLPILAIYIFLIADAIIMRSFVMPVHPQIARLYWIIVILIGVCSVWAAYATAYCVRFNGTVKEVLVINIVLVLSHPLMALEMFAFMAVGVVIAMLIPPMLIFVPSLVCLGISMPMEHVFLKHMRPEDQEKVLNE